jgi:hypothetical protein
VAWITLIILPAKIDHFVAGTGSMKNGGLYRRSLLNYRR